MSKSTTAAETVTTHRTMNVRRMKPRREAAPLPDEVPGRGGATAATVAVEAVVAAAAGFARCVFFSSAGARLTSGPGLGMGFVARSTMVSLSLAIADSSSAWSAPSWSPGAAAADVFACAAQFTSVLRWFTFFNCCSRSWAMAVTVAVATVMVVAAVSLAEGTLSAAAVFPLSAFTCAPARASSCAPACASACAAFVALSKFTPSVFARSSVVSRSSASACFFLRSPGVMPSLDVARASFLEKDTRAGSGKGPGGSWSDAGGSGKL
mmetsp:Transcript_6478/g.16125  ORF Transcript_6478/g.16125 Transcript_6478/m.16125 type:complete len:266 (+) Transcript_6478:1690-2487(+)